MFHIGPKADPQPRAHHRRLTPPLPPRRHFGKSWALANQRYGDVRGGTRARGR